MTGSRGWRLLGASVCVASLVVAGCGNGDNGDGPGDRADTAGPLAEFFGWDEAAAIGGDREFTEEERQQHYELQEYVVDCMQEAGFEYFPEPFWGDRDDIGAADDPWQEAWQLQQEDPEAYALEYGYGITTIEYERDIPESFEPEDDPNWEYQQELSEAAQQEYQKALWGDWEEVDAAEGAVDGEQVFDPAEIGGCHNEAQGEVYGWGREDFEEQQSQFENLMEEMSSMQERVENDPRVAEVAQAWSACMADAGYPGLENQWDAQEQVHDRQNEVHGWDEEPVPEATAVPEDREPGEVEPPAEPDPAELAALREFELEIAWADFECQQEHDLERVEQEVRFEYEEQFIEDHRAELEEYRDWLDQQGAIG